jgi:hypothetical protein
VRIAILSAEAALSDSLDIRTVRHSDKEESLRPQKPLKLSENSVASTVSVVAITSSSRALKTASSKWHAALEVPGADRFRAAHCQTWIQCARSSFLLAALVRVNLMTVSGGVLCWGMRLPAYCANSNMLQEAIVESSSSMPLASFNMLPATVSGAPSDSFIRNMMV